MSRRKRALLAFGYSLAIFLVLDALWIGFVVAAHFREALGPLMLETPRWGAAAAFYLVYAGGIAGFAVLPGRAWREVALRGAALGLVAYGTYDLTNLAILEAYNLRIVVLDLSWGMAGTAVTALGAWRLLEAPRSR